MPNTPRAQVFNPLSGQFNLVPRDAAQEITVATSGAMFTSIQAAINSITDASSSKPYSITIAPGVYTENVTSKDWVFIQNGLSGSVKIVGKFVATGLTGTSGLKGVTIEYTPTADNDIVCEISGGIFYLENCDIYTIGAADYICTGAKITSGTAFTIFNSTVWDRRSGNITKDYTGWHYLGSGTFGVFTASVSARGAYTNGTLCLTKLANTGSFTQSSGANIFGGTAAFSGTVRGVCCETAAIAAAPRIFSGVQIRLTGLSGGTAVGMRLNSSSNSAEIQHVNTSTFINGFTNEFISDTNVTDTQKVWFSTTNKDLTKTGTGLAIITTRDQNATGFVEWGNGTTYWTYVPGTQTFTVDRRGTGVVRSAPVVWTAGQSVVLTDLAVNFVYMTSSGVIGATTSTNGGQLYLDNIVLFEVWVQGTNFIVTKENHPWEFTSSVAKAWHSLFGSLLENATQTLTVASGVARTVNLGGTNVINDHGVSTAISAQSPVTWVQVVTGTSGLMYQIANQTGIVSRKSDAANTTGTLVAAGRHVVYRLGVIKDSINSSTPTFLCYADTTDYANQAAASNAIAAGSIAAFPAEARALEICQLGYAIVQADGAGAGTLVALTPAFQVFGAQFVSGGTSTSGSLITLNTTNFNGQLSGSESNVQLMADRLDDHGYIPSYGAGISYRVGNLVKQNQCIYRCITAVGASSTWPTDKGSFEQLSGAEFLNITTAEAASANDGDICYVIGTSTFYQYFVSAGAYPRDATFVLNTGDGGNTRWLGISGKYSINIKQDTKVDNTVNNGTITTSGETTLNAVTARLSSFSSLSVWTTGLVYRVGNTVVVSNSMYRCNTAHTAGATFVGDLANWDIVGVLPINSRVTVGNGGTIPSAQAAAQYVVTGATATIDTAVGNTGSRVKIKNTGSVTCAISSTGGQSFDGDASPLNLLVGEFVELFSNGTNWEITG